MFVKYSDLVVLRQTHCEISARPKFGDTFFIDKAKQIKFIKPFWEMKVNFVVIIATLIISPKKDFRGASKSIKIKEPINKTLF